MGAFSIVASGCSIVGGTAFTPQLLPGQLQQLIWTR
jgi:hypothetical protein